MLARTWFPALCAILLIAGGYWLIKWEPEPVPENARDLFGAYSTSTDPVTGKTSSEVTGKVETGRPNPGISTNQNIMSAILHTTMGDVTIEFNPGTPATVANFVKLAQSGFYDGTKFHRVIAGFMNQGGDPLSKDDSLSARWGTGGPGYQFADEIGLDNSNALGTIAMANSGPNTNGSQFFINAQDNSFLDPKHTSFGRVTSGLDVVMAINKVQTGEGDRPITPVVITKITLK